MDFFDAVDGRFSYRGPMDSAPVTREHLRRIVEAGLKAPSGISSGVNGARFLAGGYYPYAERCSGA